MLMNLTAHEIKVKTGSSFLTVPTSGTVARLTFKTICVGTVDDVKVFRTVSDEIEGLPPKRKNVRLIVCRAVAKKYINRDDLFSLKKVQIDRSGKKTIFCSDGFLQFFEPTSWGRFKNRVKTLMWFLK